MNDVSPHPDRSVLVPGNSTFAQDRDFGDESDFKPRSELAASEGLKQLMGSAVLPRNEEFGFIQDRDPGDEAFH